MIFFFLLFCLSLLNFFIPSLKGLSGYINESSAVFFSFLFSFRCLYIVIFFGFGLDYADFFSSGFIYANIQLEVELST